MDATNNFVLDGSVTMVWGFEDEADEYAEAILERMPDLQAHVPSLAARSGQCPAGRRTPPPHHAGRDGTVHSDPWCFSHYRR